MSFNENSKGFAKQPSKNGSNYNKNMGQDIKDHDFPILKDLISELSSNLDKQSQYLKKEKDLIEEFLRENQKMFDNITFVLKGF